jgi:hypothetical protein
VIPPLGSTNVHFHPTL